MLQSPLIICAAEGTQGCLFQRMNKFRRELRFNTHGPISVNVQVRSSSVSFITAASDIVHVKISHFCHPTIYKNHSKQAESVPIYRSPIAHNTGLTSNWMPLCARQMFSMNRTEFSNHLRKQPSEWKTDKRIHISQTLELAWQMTGKRAGLSRHLTRRLPEVTRSRQVTIRSRVNASSMRNETAQLYDF